VHQISFNRYFKKLILSREVFLPKKTLSKLVIGNTKMNLEVKDEYGSIINDVYEVCIDGHDRDHCFINNLSDNRVLTRSHIRRYLYI
jgi:hypothetical protein